MDSYAIGTIAPTEDEDEDEQCVAIARYVPVDRPFSFIRQETKEPRPTRPLRFYLWRKVFDVKKPRLFRVVGVADKGRPKYLLIPVSKKNTKRLRTKQREAFFLERLSEEDYIR